VTLYDPGTLKVLGEIPIPPKRSSNLPMMANAVLTDDDRFLLIYNFNPAQSVTVVDTKTRKFVREVETPGCALVYPTGPRSFFSMCGDGSLSLVNLDDNGAAQQKRTQPLFDLAGDPVTEKAVRVGRVWYFVSFSGRIYPLEVGPQQAAMGATWWLTSDAERKANWRPGGIQQLAVNPRQSRLYAIMHRGGVETQKDPGRMCGCSIWRLGSACSNSRSRAWPVRSSCRATRSPSCTESISTAPIWTCTTRRTASYCARSIISARLQRSWLHRRAASPPQ